MKDSGSSPLSPLLGQEISVTEDPSHVIPIPWQHIVGFTFAELEDSVCMPKLSIVRIALQQSVAHSLLSTLTLV